MPPGGTWPAADALTQIEFGLQASKKGVDSGRCRKLAGTSRAGRVGSGRRRGGDPRLSDGHGMALGGGEWAAEPVGEVVSDPQGVGDDGERGVHCGAGDEEARVDDAEVVELVHLAVEVQGRGGRVGAEPDGAVLVGHPTAPGGRPVVAVLLDLLRQCITSAGP
jgi:hypothetical protein